jgi:phage gp36-like protein
MAEYVTPDELKDALGAHVVRALYDDDNSGEPDAAPIASAIRRATSKVNAYLRRLYVLPIAEPIPDIIKSITLDLTIAYAQLRHPEVVRVDGEKLIKAAEADLERLRDGKIELDIPTLPKALNEQIELRRGPLGAAGEPSPPVFTRGIGDFSR